MIRILTIIAFFMLLNIPSQCYAADGVDLTLSGNNATIDQSDLSLNVDGNKYPIVLKGAPTTMPQIVGGGLNGDHAVRIELDPASGCGPDNGRDKINYKIVSGRDEDSPTFDGKIFYYGFAVKLDPTNFMTPTMGRGYLLAQVWQGAPFGPPLSFQILPASSPDENPRIAFEIRNDQTGGNAHAKTIKVYPKHINSLQRGKWYKVIMEVRLGFKDDAILKVWINNDQEPEISWHGNIGYNPDLTGADLGFTTGKGVNKSPNKSMEIYFGPYRDRMDSTQFFYFDQIVFGSKKISSEQ